MMKPNAPIAAIPRPVIITTFEYSSEVGLRAILRTRPYFPFPRCLTRSSMRRWTSQLLSTMSAITSPHDVDAAMGAHVLPGAEDLFRADAGQDEHDAQFVLQARIDRGAPDDPGVRSDAALDDLRDLFRLGDAHVVSAGDIHKGARRAADVDIDQGGVDGLLDGLFGPVVRVRFPQANHRDAPSFHDCLDVVEIQVHEARLRDDLRDPLDRAHEHIVRDLEGRVQRQARDEFKQFVIRNHDDRVREAPELLEPVLGILGSDGALGPEGEGADRDCKGAGLLRELRKDRSSSRARATSEAARDEDHVGPVDDGPQFVRGLAGGLLPDLGKGAGSKTPGHPATEEELVRRPDHEQVLRIRVRGEELGSDNARLDEAVNRVAASAAYSNDLDVRSEAP